ncbi:MAG: hypothetical protein ACREM6_13485, partial [Vulcanimicrobiaceae bacterium]
ALGRVTPAALPIPQIALDARLGSIELVGNALPYVPSAAYGAPDQRATRSATLAFGTVRFALVGTPFAFGVGYGTVRSMIAKTAPPGSLASQAEGVRFELAQRIRVGENAALELVAGAFPALHGSATTLVGIPGATNFVDGESGTQYDGTATFTFAGRGPLVLETGLSYVRRELAFAASGAPLERDAVVSPFLRVGVRFGRR